MEHPVDFTRLARERYSVRSFDATPLTEEETEKILHAGHLAPTACNLQPQVIYVLQSREALAKLRQCTRCHFDAPAAFLVCYDLQKAWKRKWDGKHSGEIDAAIVASHMMLEAASIGVGSTWVMYFDPDTAREVFALAPHIIPVCFLVMGHAAPDAAPSELHAQCRPQEEMVVRL